jgi:hypothetical protein
MEQQIVKDIPYYQRHIDTLKVHLETCSNPDTIAIIWNSIDYAYRKIAELRLAELMMIERQYATLN